MNYGEKILRLGRAKKRFGDEDLSWRIPLWRDKPEADLKVEEMRMIDSYFYRYRKQTCKDKPELQKLSYHEFFKKLNRLETDLKPEHRSRMDLLKERQRTQERLF
jgi:hypothetical protein